MKELTNDVYRTKRKLKLLEEDGIGQLLSDFYLELADENTSEKTAEQGTISVIQRLKEKYNTLLSKYKPKKQYKMNFDEKTN